MSHFPKKKLKKQKNKRQISKWFPASPLGLNLYCTLELLGLLVSLVYTISRAKVSFFNVRRYEPKHSNVSTVKPSMNEED